MAGSSYSRRAFLRNAGFGAAGVAVGGPALLAACSKSKSPFREVRVSNAPLSIDDSTPAAFEKGSGIFLRYHEYDDPAAYERTAAVKLRAHDDIGADVVVLPDHQTAQLIEGGWVRPLPAAAARRRVLPAFANPHFDPGRRYSLPWTSTMVGLAYDRRYVREPIRSAGALFDATFAGKVVLSADAEATLGLVALASGHDPAKITEAEASAAVQRVRAAVGGGQVRSFATTEYVDDLVSQRAMLAVARADAIKDAIQIYPTLAFVVPTEGGLLESTNMVVPNTARNVDEAADFIEYVFRPGPMSLFASFAGRVMPIIGGIDSLRLVDMKSSINHLVEPDPTVWSRLSIWGGSPKSAAAADFAALVASTDGSGA
jgi:spermidine/putrescine transport system substrate-binding protein